MKKKYLLLTTGLLILALAAGCGSKTGETTDNVKQEAQVSQTEEKTLTGTLEEVKDFMFIVTDESGASYEFSFDEKPEGLDAVAAGDKVQVTYTGEISEVDPFTGTVISVEKQ